MKPWRIEHVRLIAATVLLSGALAGAPAQANTIEIEPNNPTGQVSDGSVLNTFLGYLEDGSTSFEDAFGFAIAGGNNLTNEAAKLSELTGLTFSAADGEKTELVNDPTEGEHVTGIVIPAGAYFLLKIDGDTGAGTAFFHNFSASALNLSYDKLEGARNAGLSHYTIFADPGIVIEEVPGPIIGAGLPGLILSFGGALAWARHRRRKIASN